MFVVVVGIVLVGLGVISPASVQSTTANPASVWQVAAIVAAGILVIAFGVATAAVAWVPYAVASMKRIASLISLDGARFELNVNIGGLAAVSALCALIFIFSLGLLAPLSGAIYARHVMNRLVMVGQPRFAEIGQPLVAAPGSGEGMVDAFDLDLGIGIV
jgi:uncharacterized membrane protein YjgN (DUF898 family)